MLQIKPQSPYPRINWNHPLAKQLVAVFLCNERQGSLLNLVDKTTKLSLVNSGKWGLGKIGSILDCSVANDSGAWNTTPPASLLIAKQVSFFWQGSLFTGYTNYGWLAGMTYTNSDTPPYSGYSLLRDNLGNLQMNFNTDGGGAFGAGVTFTPKIGYDGSERQYLFTIQSGAQKIYENGLLNTSDVQTYTSILYGSNPQFGIGIYQNGIARNGTSKCSLCYVWNRVLSPQEAILLYTNPLVMFKLPINYYGGMIFPNFIPNKLRPAIFKPG